MSRITVIAILMILLPATSFAAAPSCGNQVWGFNVYERLQNGKIVEKHSIFEIDDWSDHSSFQGILNKSKKDSTLEIEVRKEGNSIKTQSWPFKAWDLNAEYKEAKGFNAIAFFKGLNVDSYFVMRVKQGNKVICESAPLEVYGND